MSGTVEKRVIFQILDMVKVKQSVKTPKFDWGAVNHQMVGRIKSIDADGDLRVDFGKTDATNWACQPTEMEIVRKISDDPYFAIGSKVKVKSSIKEPTYKWGSVSSQSVGIVKGYDSDGYTPRILVNFAKDGVKEWKGLPSEMELAQDRSLLEGELEIGSKVRLKVSVKRPKFGKGHMNHEATGVIKFNAVHVKFPSRSSTWMGDPDDLEVVSEQGKVLADEQISEGKKVRIKETVSEPKFGWGDNVNHKSIGEIEERVVLVKIDGESKLWRGMADELDTLPEDDSDSDDDAAGALLKGLIGLQLLGALAAGGQRSTSNLSDVLGIGK